MNIGDKKELTTEEIKTLSQEQFEAYVQKEDSQTLNEILELRGNLPIFIEDDEEKDKKVCADLVEKCQKYMAEEDQDIDAFKEVFKTAQSLLKNSTTLSDKERIQLHILKGNIQDDVRNVIEQDDWDLLMVAHPPCTRLCNSGVRWLDNPPPGKTKEEMYAELDEGA